VPGYLFLLVLLVILWLFLVRPRQRQVRAQRQQIASIQVGDEIVTAGGLYGTVRTIDADELRVEIAPNVEVRVAKRAVAGVLTDHEALEPVEESEANLPET
jgi:preprotein translocase subunit YajC